MIARALVLLILTITSSLVSGQSELRFEPLQSSNNLSQRSVTNMVKDHLGFLWIGTYNGLNKFDGYKFISYNLYEKSPNNISSNYIKTIHEDKSGFLWIYTLEDKMLRFDPASEKIISFPDNSTIKDVTCKMFEFDDSTQWVITNKIGLYIISQNKYNNTAIIKHLTNNSPQPILSNYINFLVKDSVGNYWIGSKKGLNKININSYSNLGIKIAKFDTLQGISHNSSIIFTKAIKIGSYICFYSTKKGFIFYNSTTGKFNYPKNENLNKLIADKTITLIIVNQQNVWFCTNNLQLFKYNITSSSLSTYDLSRYNNIKKIFFDSFNQVWLSTDKYGIIRIDVQTSQIKQYNFIPYNKNILIYGDDFIWYEDRHSNLWIGSQVCGLSLYDRKNNTFITYLNDPNNNHSISSNTISSLIEDNEDDLLVGLDNGINRVIQTNSEFKYIKPRKLTENNDDNSVRAVLEDSNLNLWIATKGAKIYIYSVKNKVENSYQTKNVINSNYNVYKIFQDHNGFIWLCTKGSGLYKSKLTIKAKNFDYNNILFINYSLTTNNSSSTDENKVYDITEDNNNNLWIATFGGGLIKLHFDKYNNLIKKYFTTENSNISGNLVRCVIIDSKSRIWIGTTKGLSYFKLDETNYDKINFINFKADPSNNSDLSCNDIIKILEDKNGTIWLATNGGGVNHLTLSKYGKAIFKHYNTNNGLCDNLALSLANDQNGNIWIGTDHGLSKLNPKNDHIINFNEKNGLPCLNFSENASILDDNGNIVIGSLNGFYIINPNIKNSKPLKSLIQLTGFQLFNREVIPGDKNSPLKQSISYTKNIILNYNQSAFSIEFSSLLYNSSPNVLYSYILEGFDKTWSYASQSNKAVYTNIPYGKYIFKVKCTNIDGSWGSKIATLTILIRPPLWKTYYAYIIYFILIIVIIQIILKIIVKITRLENDIVIEKKVAESKLRFFTNISHEFRTPLTLIIGPLESLIDRNDISKDIKNQLKLANRNVNRLLRLINQLLDFRKIQQDNVKLSLDEFDIVPFLKQIYDCYEAASKQKNIDFKFLYSQSSIKIIGDLQKLDIVFFNLLSNAFKYTYDNKTISLVVFKNTEKKCIEVILSDQGKGIEAADIPFIFDRFFVSHTNAEDPFTGTGIGLSLAMEYVKLHHGNIEVKSQKDVGSVFKVTLPLDVNYGTKQLIQHKNNTSIHSHEPIIDESENDELVSVKTLLSGEKPLILIVEDDVDMGHYISNILSNTYSIILAKDGEECWKKIQKTLPDIVITDIIMPKMNGLELLKKIKEDETTCHLPVILLSAKSEISDQIKGIETGAEWYISKPFNQNLLLSYLKTIIHQREIIREKFKSTIELKPDEIQIVSKDKIFIEKAITIINENLSDPNFTVEKLSANFEMSRTVFFKKLKTITGHQPVEFIRLIRLKRAAQLLLLKQFNISEIAFQSGFNDVRYFSSCFKKQFGLTPTEYINKDI